MLLFHRCWTRNVFPTEKHHVSANHIDTFERNCERYVDVTKNSLENVHNPDFLILQIERKRILVFLGLRGLMYRLWRQVYKKSHFKAFAVL